jgi:hypothetical protein
VKKKLTLTGIIVLILLGIIVLVLMTARTDRGVEQQTVSKPRSALVTGLKYPVREVIIGHDATRPRGAPEGVSNNGGQDLSPVVYGFKSPAYRAGDHKKEYKDWAGTIMANAMRDPAFFATLSVANKDVIRLINNVYNKPENIEKIFTGDTKGFNDFSELLKLLRLDKENIKKRGKKLQPEDILPVTADLCLRCHSPVGWMEGRSEPKTRVSPFLKGQFWGAAFRENPSDHDGNPRSANLTKESETDMEGIQCDFCHRAKDTFKRKSLYDGSEMSNGIGGFFVERHNPFCEGTYDKSGNCREGKYTTSSVFQKEGAFCGTCHDVTNPLIRTRTVVNGAVPEDMPHPIERTYTEWYWSDYREKRTCQDCHDPMSFPGAQTWMIYPVLEELWGDVDEKWGEEPYNYYSPNRTALWKRAMERNRKYMRNEAAEMSIINTSVHDDTVNLEIKIINKCGHKLPTGFAEGRQMWLHIRATDDAGKVIFESGYMEDGYLVRDKYRAHGKVVDDPDKNMIKVYEMEVIADGYDKSVIAKGNEHFHFMLMNKIIKDNRIPPKGFNKEAYTADGAFIIPHDPKDNDYADGQDWDITPYTFTVPEGKQGKISVTATLNYQTFSREYLEFLKKNDVELTKECGGRARNLPILGSYDGADCDNYGTWGLTLYDLWEKADMGPPVIVQESSIEISVNGRK